MLRVRDIMSAKPNAVSRKDRMMASNKIFKKVNTNYQVTQDKVRSSYLSPIGIRRGPSI